MTNEQTNPILPGQRSGEASTCDTCGAPAQLTTYDVESATTSHQCQACFIRLRTSATV